MGHHSFVCFKVLDLDSSIVELTVVSNLVFTIILKLNLQDVFPLLVVLFLPELYEFYFLVVDRFNTRECVALCGVKRLCSRTRFR